MSDAPDTKVAPQTSLDRGSYRRRRVWDAVRMLPFLGIVLWMVPVMWPEQTSGEGVGISTSVALLYLFGIWVLLVLGARLLWCATSQSMPSPPD